MNLGKFSFQAKLDAEAADWLARRDRGLTPREQDAYLQWLREDERRPAAIARAEATLRRVLQLSAWRHEHSPEPNPDLLARPRRTHPWRWAIAAAAAAVIVGISIGVWSRPPATRNAAVVAKKNYLRTNQQIALPDGSRAELRDGSQFDVLYTAGERRVRLTGGEAQFSVMKDTARPFVVEAGGVAVRAVGTVFDVRLGDAAVEVLVTEGKVRVGRAATGPGEIFQTPAAGKEPPIVAAGERAVVALAEVSAPPTVAVISSEEMRRELAWQAPWLHFDETPLAEAVAEFNRLNHHQLVLGDAELAQEPIGGTFNPNNVDGFVRLLSVTLGVRAEPHGADETVLWRGR
jgi:transmembrane sensor